VAVAAVVVWLVAACGGVTSYVVVTGSSTVEPISIAVAEEFSDENPDVAVTVDGPGTGDGFELFCNGEADVNDASSKIAEEQIETCEENGVEFIELQIGNDGIAVVTSSENDAVECLSLADLYALLGPESQGVDRWSGARALAEELGSTTELPDVPLDVTGPGEESGTFASFVELVIEEFNEQRGTEPTTRPDYQASADDNVILRGVEGSDTSLGWVGFAFVADAPGLKVIEVDGGEGCVPPTPETIASGEYPVSRPLYIYVNAAEAEEGTAVADFVDTYLYEAVEAVDEVGYVGLSEDDLAETRRRWETRTEGAA
jgi:phosphate transport system substrate-binding protein